MSNNDIERNTVSALEQVHEKFKMVNNVKGGLKVLFLGNSITLHEKKPEIGWYNNWGMAASKMENDYVHLVVKGLENHYGEFNYCITNVGLWEQNFWDDAVLKSFYASSDFSADIVIVRLGENINRDRLKDYNFEEYFEKFVRYFSRQATRIIITNLFWPYEELDAAIKNVSKYVNGQYVSISDLGCEDENKAIGLFEHEGVALHPGDKGMAKIAERILAAMGKL